MSSKTVNKNIVEIEDEDDLKEIFPDISKLIIPFSVVFNISHEPDIYTGTELIPFEQKDSEFKEILICEFLSEEQKIE
ncbi:MAG: hypothetical protein ACFFG0_05705 [Candidatus Thorarchaeota archaeon]